MNNHKTYTLEYNKDEILNVLKKYLNNQSAVVKCSILEVSQISKILDFKVPIKSILYFQLPPKFVSNIHKDYYLASEISYALNLPLSECNDVSMKWFNQVQPNTGVEFFPGPSYGRPTPALNYENAICKDDINYNLPTLVKINDWHNVTNYSTNTTATFISIRYKDLSPDSKF